MFDYERVSNLMANNVVNLNGKYFVVIPLPFRNQNDIKPGYYVVDYQQGIIIMKYFCSLEDQEAYREQKIKRIVVKISKTLRFTIPKDFRAKYDIYSSILIGYDSESEELYMRPYLTSCVICHSLYNLYDFGEKKICSDCISSIIDTFSKVSD